MTKLERGISSSVPNGQKKIQDVYAKKLVSQKQRC